MKRVVEILILVGVFALGYYLGWSPVNLDEETTRTVDTTHYDRPMPIEIKPPTFENVRLPILVKRPSFENVRLPMLVFAPPTVVVRDSIIRGDSVDVQVEIETKIYGDSTFKAQVSGAVVGGIRPSLDWIDIYSHTTTITRTTFEPPEWQLSATTGVDLRSQWVGLAVERSWGRVSVRGVAGYEPFNESTYISLQANITLGRW